MACVYLAKMGRAGSESWIKDLIHDADHFGDSFIHPSVEKIVDAIQTLKNVAQLDKHE